MGFGIQPSSERKIAFGNKDAQASASGGQGRSQPCRTRANHKKIAEGISLFIGIGIVLAAETAEPCRPTDRGLIKFFPKRRRPHEGLVVKAGNQYRACDLVDRANVEAK